jgi:predicted regulator of Ras-like GTPase activity (Roadblock/LC7/MglB family)
MSDRKDPSRAIQRSRGQLASAVFAAVPGIRACWVGDLDGNPVDEQGHGENSRGVLLAAAALARALGVIGARFELGSPELVTTKGRSRSLVVAYRGESLIAVDVESSRPLKNIESTLREMDWEVASDWVLSDGDIEYLPEERPDSDIGSTPPTQTDESTSPVASAEPTEEVSTNPSAVAIACAELRRALAKGQLLIAAQTAGRVRPGPSAADHSLGSSALSSSEMDHVFLPLLNAIADVVAGDGSAGLQNLELVRKMPQIGPSLEWAARIWSARASAQMPKGLEAAAAHAEAALRIAAGLDAEAQAMSGLVFAEIKNQEGEWGRALELLAGARSAFVGNSREIAACWLLEARIWETLKREKESADAAEHARACCPWWQPAVTFIVKHALGAGRLLEAERALEGLLATTPVPPEAERDRRVIEHVRAGEVPVATACQYLDLLDAPESPMNLRRLQEIAAGFPRIAQFRETLGWKLLNAGESDAARKVFKELSAREGLSRDLRASVLLGLGCLATKETSGSPSSVKLRAVVDAGPADALGKATPPVSSLAPTSKPRRTDPMDLRVRDTSLTPSPGSLRLDPTALRRKKSTGPAFSGSLQMCGLPELLEVLRTGQKTGTLVCSSAAGIGAIHLRSGKVTGAAAPNSSNLCNYLLARNAVTAEQLQTVEQLSNGARPALAIDLRLLEQGLVTVEQLQQALRDQVLAAFTELIEWREGQFAFDRDLVVSVPSGAEIDLDPQAVLLEVYAAHDEHSTPRQ